MKLKMKAYDSVIDKSIKFYHLHYNKKHVGNIAYNTLGTYAFYPLNATISIINTDFAIQLGSLLYSLNNN